MDRRRKNSLRLSLRGGVESVWLGGLDSNQDNQIQNLMYCQLYDLPAEGRQTTKKATRGGRPISPLPATPRFVNGWKQSPTALAGPGNCHQTPLSNEEFPVAPMDALRKKAGEPHHERKRIAQRQHPQFTPHELFGRATRARAESHVVTQQRVTRDKPEGRQIGAGENRSQKRPHQTLGKNQP